MSKGRFAFLLIIVITAGGFSVLVAGLAISTEHFDNTTIRALLPLLLLTAVSGRALMKSREK